jgi:hypothetical protein
LLLAIPKSARALERVLVLGTEPGNPDAGFVEALRIQLSGIAVVELGETLRGSLADRIGQVDAELESKGALLAVWTEESPRTPPSEREVLLYIASRRKSRVLVDVAQLPASDGPDAARALALKVREVLDTLIASKRADPAIALVPQRPVAAVRSRDATRRWLLIEAGAVSSGTTGANAGVQAGATVGIGARVRQAPLRLELVAIAQALNALEARSGSSYVRASEVDLAASLRLLARGAALRGGGHLEAGARLIDAEGATADGRSGEASRHVPFVRLGPELRLALGGALELRAAVGFEAALRRQRFVIDGARVLELGMLRGLGELSLLVALP